MSSVALHSKDLTTLLKPLADYRKYRFLQLPNGLKVVVVSDLKDGEEPCRVLVDQSCPTSPQSATSASSVGEEETGDEDMEEEAEGGGDDGGGGDTQKAAVALCVGVGSFSDPLECQGLAHYLEHMVFMGSEKYPNENDFDAFVSQRGGYSNAFTTDKRTVFYYTIRPGHLQESIDRFANFFIAPLLNKDSMDREMTAVHSEYEMLKINDDARLEGLLQLASKEGTPYRTFTCGSKKSLYEIPKEKGVDIYAFLKQLRINMYSANLMTLAVIAKDSVENLETLVRKVFADVPNSGGKAADFSAFQLPMDTPAFHRLYKVNPIKDENKLMITWALPSHYHEYKSHPKEMLSYLLGHEGPGSIISLLRKQHLAVGLTAGYNPSDPHQCNEMNELVCVEITLTDEGVHNYQKVVSTVFQYVHMLRTHGVPQEMFDEHKKLSELTFKHKSISSPVASVQRLCENLQFVSDLDWLLAAFKLPQNFPKDIFHQMLELMTPEKANYVLTSKKLAAECTQTEEWYGAQYTIEDIPHEQYAQWKAATPNPDLHLPSKNIFLPEKFNVLPVDEKLAGSPVDLINEIPGLDSKYGHLFYKMDKKFSVPKAYVKAILWSPETLASLKNQVLHEMLIYAIDQAVSDVAYFATLASFTYNISGRRFVELQCYGFSDTLHVLYETLVRQLKDFHITDAQFHSYKTIFRQKFTSRMRKPRDLLFAVREKVAYTDYGLASELLAELKDLKVEDLRHFHKSLLAKMRASLYVHGNVTAEDAKKMYQFLVNALHFQPVPEIVRPKVRVFPVGDVRVRVYNLNEEDVNTALVNNYQLGPVDLFHSCVMEVLVSVLQEPGFNFLRTKEMLGYSVGVDHHADNGIANVVVYVLSQTDKFSLEHCFEKMQHFVNSMTKEILDKLPAEDFKDFVEAAIAERRREDVDMTKEAERNVREIQSEEFLFQRREKQTEALQKIKMSDLKEMLNKILSASSCRHMSVQVESRRCPKATPLSVACDDWRFFVEPCHQTVEEVGNVHWIKDLNATQKWEVYPYHKIL